MAGDHIKLLCDIGELNWVFTGSNSIESFLQKVVEMVANHSNADVCSIYLYDENKQELVLTATRGLNPDGIGKVKLGLDEGLAGLALRESRAVCEDCGKNNPHFKFFTGIHEEHYDAFLAVPILRGLSKVGVLVVQRGSKKYFTQPESLAMRAVASQLANMIESAKLLMSIHNRHADAGPIKPAVPVDVAFIRGKAAATGYALAPATVIDRDKMLAMLYVRHFDKHYGLAELDEAIRHTEEQLTNLQKQVESKLSDVASLIFTAHLLILKDQSFVGAMRKMAEQGANAAEAVLSIAKEYIAIFSSSANTFLREKVQDVQDLTLRLVRNLLKNEEDVGRFAGRVVIAKELFPSDLLKMSSEQVAGIVLVSGGVTSHLSILARSLRIPTIIANRLELMGVEDGTPVLIDAESGNLYVDPSEQIRTTFQAKEHARISLEDQKRSMKPETFTKDGTRIRLLSNINLLADVKLARDMHAEGIGLYRTEFPFMIRSDFPSEEEQYVVYRKLVEQMHGKVITFRTLDMGGDKVLSYYHNAHEENPCLGMRAIRFSLQNTVIFSQQIRAMLRAGFGADLKIMFPMISSLDEFESAKQLVNECVGALQYEGIEHNGSPAIGMMVEIPSVLDLIDSFADIADFFSIGTNDFTQYMLAADRTNEKVAGYYQPCHPAVLRALKRLVDAAAAHGREISVCGDMAHDIRYLPFLIGIGVRVLSVEPIYLPVIQRAIEHIDLADARQIASRLVSMTRLRNVEELIDQNGQSEVIPWR